MGDFVARAEVTIEAPRRAVWRVLTSNGARVTLDQDNNPTREAAEHSQQNWSTMLAGVKTVVKRSAAES